MTAPDNPAADLVPQPLEHVAAFAARLLRYIRQHARLYRTHSDQKGKADHLYRSAVDGLRQRRQEIVQPDTAAFITGLNHKFNDIQPVLRARAIAEALDTEYSDLFLGFFQGRGVLNLNCGDPFPVSRQPVWKPDALSTDPFRSGDRYDALRTLRLVPDLGGLELVVDPNYEAYLDDLFSKQRPTFATALLNHSFDSEYQTTAFDESGRQLFFEVVPSDPGGQLQRARDALRLAIRAGVDVLVFPELCFDAATMEHFISRLDDKDEPLGPAPSLVVAGSRHVRREGRRYNECVATLSGAPRPFVHTKFAPFDHGGRIEAIDTSAKLTVFYSKGRTCLLLVCKDLLDRDVTRVIEELGIDLVLVPALTFKSRAFEQRIAGIESKTQSFVVLANNAVRSVKTPPASAVFGVPTRDNSVRVARWRKHHNLPGINILYRYVSLKWQSIS